jgi:predicted DNA-binding transcriptional regulator AlpA
MKLYNSTEAAEYFGISRRQLFRWRKKNDFPKPIINKENYKVWGEWDLSVYKKKLNAQRCAKMTDSTK